MDEVEVKRRNHLKPRDDNHPTIEARVMCHPPFSFKVWQWKVQTTPCIIPTETFFSGFHTSKWAHETRCVVTYTDMWRVLILAHLRKWPNLRHCHAPIRNLFCWWHFVNVPFWPTFSLFFLPSIRANRRVAQRLQRQLRSGIASPVRGRRWPIRLSGMVSQWKAGKMNSCTVDLFWNSYKWVLFEWTRITRVFGYRCGSPYKNPNPLPQKNLRVGSPRIHDPYHAIYIFTFKNFTTRFRGVWSFLTLFP